MILLFYESITLKKFQRHAQHQKPQHICFHFLGRDYSLAPRVIIQFQIRFLWKLYIYHNITEHIFSTVHSFYFICVSFCWTSSYSLIFAYFIHIKRLLYFQDKLPYYPIFFFFFFFWGGILYPYIFWSCTAWYSVMRIFEIQNYLCHFKTVDPLHGVVLNWEHRWNIFKTFE